MVTPPTFNIMELEYEELNSYLLSIFSSKKIIALNKNGEDVILVLKQPNNSIKLLSEIMYKRSYDKALKEGLNTTEEIEKLLSKRGIFTEEDINKIESIESKLEGQKVLLAKTTKVKANSDRIKKIIEGLEREINEIRYKKYSNLMMSAETKAEEDRNIFICSKCVYYFDSDDLYWKDNNAIMLEKDLVFRGNVLSEFTIFMNGFSQDIIRSMARSSLWRVRYIHSNKCSDPLFGIPSTEYSNDQFNLVYWSSYYQNIYEMMPEDRPSDIVIEDDEALDAYMTSYYAERTREDASKKSKHSTGGKMSAFDKEEVIVTQSNELYEDIKYDKPREAKRIKDRTDIKKRTKRR